jgi:deglycase
MGSELSGKRVVFIVSNEGIEQAELTEPWGAVKGAGGTPVLAAARPGEAQAFRHLDKADSFAVDVTTDSLTLDDVDAIVIPGGVANADQLRTDDAAVGFIGEFFHSGKPVAVICHGPWALVEADVLKDRRLTSWPSLKTDITNAGGEWVDETVVVCSNGPNTLVTSRKPDDLPTFCREAVAAFASGRKVKAA